MTPAERVREQMRRLVREAPPADGQAPAFGIGQVPAPVLDTPALVVKPDSEATAVTPAPASSPGRRGGKRHHCARCQGYLETRWYQCLLYPLRALLLIAQLAVALTSVASAILFFLPLLLQHAALPWERIFYCWLPCLVLLFCVGGYVCAFLDVTLSATAAGRVRHVVWPGRDAVLVLRAIATWFFCFLAGPVVLVAVAGWYWFHCGDPDGLDWFILTELSIVAVGYWLLGLLAVKSQGRLGDANPARIAELFEWLGPRALLAALLASAILLSHGYMVAAALEEFHRNLASSVLQLAACFMSELFWATFLFRLLGVWCHLAPARR
jgi:hypothetical protein